MMEVDNPEAKIQIHTDGFEGWSKRAKNRASLLDAGEALELSRSITMEEDPETILELRPWQMDMLESLGLSKEDMKRLHVFTKPSER